MLRLRALGLEVTFASARTESSSKAPVITLRRAEQGGPGVAKATPAPESAIAEDAEMLLEAV